METPATVQVEEICRARASGVAGWWVSPSLLVAEGPAPWEGQSFLSLNPSTSLTRKLRKPVSAALFASCLPWVTGKRQFGARISGSLAGGPSHPSTRTSVRMIYVGVLDGSCSTRTCWGARGQCPHLWLALPKGGLGD